jgi:O-antigen ligase
VFESLIWIVPVVVLFAGAYQPRYGILALLAALPLFGAPPGGPYLGALEAAVLAAIATAWRAGPARPSRLDRPLMAFVLVAVASFFPLAYLPPAWSPRVLIGLAANFPFIQKWTVLYTWRALADLLLGWGLFLAMKRAFAGRSPAALGGALAAGSAGALIVGILEFAGTVDLWSYRPIGAPLYDQRFHSLFFHSGWFAEYLVLSVPLAVVSLFLGSRWMRVSGLLLVTASLVALTFTQQRGAWGASCAQILLVAVLFGKELVRDRRRMRLVLASVSVIGLLVVGVFSIRPHTGRSVLERMSRVTQDNRTWIWKASLEAAQRRPLLGWGVGSFSPVLDLEVTPGTSHRQAWLTAHSTYFMLLAERGVLGLAGLGLVGLAALSALRESLRGESREGRILAVGLLLCAAGFALYGLVQYLFFPRAVGLLVWVLLGAVAVLDSGGRKQWTDRIALALMVVGLAMIPIRAVAHEPPAARGSRSYGFHAPEKRKKQGSHQWTAGHAARRLEWEGETLLLEIANGHPRAGERPVSVEVMIDGVVVSQLEARGGWEEHRIDVGPPTKDSLVLELRVRPTFRPFSDYRRYPDLPDSRDIRRLGIAVGKVGWE